jgi:hypothetical protein
MYLLRNKVWEETSSAPPAPLELGLETPGGLHFLPEQRRGRRDQG